MKTVAEGVETEAQKKFLVAAGCGQMQGYLFSKPLPSKEITELLVKHFSGPAPKKRASGKKAGKTPVKRKRGRGVSV